VRTRAEVCCELFKACCKVSGSDRHDDDEEAEEEGLSKANAVRMGRTRTQMIYYELLDFESGNMIG
jgi:hypothetical protein